MDKCKKSLVDNYSECWNSQWIDWWIDGLIVSALSIIGLIPQSPSHFPVHLNQTLYRNNKTTERGEERKKGTHFFLFLSPWVWWLMCCVSRVFPPCLSPSISLFLSCSRFPRWRSHQTALLRQVDRFHFASITEATGESFCFKGLWLCNQPFAGMLWVIREQLYAGKDQASVCVTASLCLSVCPWLGLRHEGSHACQSTLKYLQLTISSLKCNVWPLSNAWPQDKLQNSWQTRRQGCRHDTFC